MQKKSNECVAFYYYHDCHDYHCLSWSFYSLFFIFQTKLLLLMTIRVNKNYWGFYTGTMHTKRTVPQHTPLRQRKETMPTWCLGTVKSLWRLKQASKNLCKMLLWHIEISIIFVRKKVQNNIEHSQVFHPFTSRHWSVDPWKPWELPRRGFQRQHPLKQWGHHLRNPGYSSQEFLGVLLGKIGQFFFPRVTNPTCSAAFCTGDHPFAGVLLETQVLART